MDKHTTVIYQIYPKSFKDTTGSGTGDLRGVIEGLDYVQELGAEMIWLNPFYPSPQYDNGYDISNYTAIDPSYGTMEEFEALVEEASKRNIGLMLDMVLNHCSTEHEWFQKALAGDPYYQDFFYLRPLKEDGSLPTNWESKFGGPAWSKFGETDLYYLHLYDTHQADLNWHNPNVRQALFDVVNFWIDKGVKGFRFDVLNVIGKEEQLMDSEEPNSSQEKSLYTDTPQVHKWVKELNEATFGQYDDLLTVGEMSSTNVPNGIQYTADGTELDMIFSFHHLKVDYLDGEKWSLMDFDFIELKKILNEWQRGMSDGDGWNALFLNNHDQPRANSRFGDPTNFPFETATLLAQMIHFLRGTPYIYQGEEIGMTDPGFNDITTYRDIETLNHYDIMKQRGLSEEETMAIIQSKSRDNSRTPMQWDDTVHGGFTTGEPWLSVANNYATINVAQRHQNGIFNYYQQLIQLRKEHPVISHGTYEGLLLNDPKVMAYIREYDGVKLFVIGHFYEGEAVVNLPEDLSFDKKSAEKLIGNGPLSHLTDTIVLGSYETAAFIIN